MTKPAEPRLTARERATLARIQNGGGLMVQFGATSAGEAGGGHLFFTVSGKSLPPKTTAKLLADGALSPRGDGLFAEETSQTFDAIPGWRRA